MFKNLYEYQIKMTCLNLTSESHFKIKYNNMYTYYFLYNEENFMEIFTTLTRKVSQVSLIDFNDSLICCRASKNKTHVIFFIGGKADLGGEIDPQSYGCKGMFSWFFIEQVDIF